ALLILVQLCIFPTVQQPLGTPEALNSCRRLNREILDGSPMGQRLKALASPVIGGGIPLGRADHLFLTALRSGAKSPEEWASYAWSGLEKDPARESIAHETGVALG